MHLSARQLRLASGSVLLLYVAWHLANHALGLVSVAAADTGRKLFITFWRSWPVTLVFYAALLAHFALALQSLVERRSLRMPAMEALRLVLGFSIPFFLAIHFANTRVVAELTGFEDTYERVVALMWARNYTVPQLSFTMIAWVHGVLGVHFAFRHRARWRAAHGWLVFAATAFPLLAACGYLSMARELEARAMKPAPLSQEEVQVINGIAEALMGTALALVMLAFAWRGLRNIAARRAGRMVRIAYPGRSVEVALGASVLEASRAHGVPHMSLCGGRARCSTCRVRVRGDPEALPPPGHDEARTLQRIRAAPDVRLACQLRPRGPVQVEPLLAGFGRPDDERFPGGRERDVVVLFADLRRWTGLSEEHLPMDLVYVLDRYFEAVGDAVREAGGVPNQFIGDSVMALFGVDSDDAATGARQALAAAAEIARRMALLNEEIAPQFGRRLDFGIGIHAGLAAVGSVGYRDTRTLSAVGDAVNTASRLQELTKALRTGLVVSEDVLRAAGFGPQGWTTHEVEVRGRQQRLRVYARDALSGA